MARSRVRSATQILVLLIACTGSLVIGAALRNSDINSSLLGPQVVAQQSSEKQIDIKLFPKSPFEISDLEIKKVKITPGQKINTSLLAEREGETVDDWLDGLQFTIKNKWDKQITYIKIDLDFPETSSRGPMLVGTLDVGVHPWATGNAKQFGKPIIIEPGEVFTYAISKSRLALNKQFLEKRGFQLANLSRAVVRISSIVFNDDTSWSEGKWFKFNRDIPNVYERIEP